MIFEIKTNKAGQRILLLEHQHTTTKYRAVSYKQFDAVMVLSKNSRVVKWQYTNIIQPLTNPAFQFKPIFLNPQLSDKILKSACDGLTNDINSSIVIDTVATIQQRMAEINFKIIKREQSFWTHERILFAIHRHLLIRGDALPELVPIKGSQLGYMLPLVYAVAQTYNINSYELLKDRQRSSEEYKYTKNEKMVARVYLCPKCFDRNSIYMESCPKCGSIDIDEYSMIHHFRCANITPDYTYQQGRHLICPKCSYELRHIGVDYDRPASSYICNNCSTSFTEPIIKCYCQNCGTISKVYDLIPAKLYNSSFTHLGCETYAQNDEYPEMDNIPKYDNILSYNSLIDTIRVRLEVYNNVGDAKRAFAVFKITIHIDREASNTTFNTLTMELYHILPMADIAMRENRLYIFEVFDSEEHQSEAFDRVGETFQNIMEIEYNMELLVYELGEDREHYIDQLY
ncbi:MAG: hypothetical protein SNG35_04190 [Rikenellaceae bacterium]